jgi:hypothetical protein
LAGNYITTGGRMQPYARRVRVYATLGPEPEIEVALV